MVPYAFTNLPHLCAGNLKLVDLVIKFLDPFGVIGHNINEKLQSFYQQLLLGTFSLFGTNDQMLQVLGNFLIA